MKSEDYLDTIALSESLLPWLTPGAIRNLVMRGKIPFRKVGGRLVFIKSEISEWVETSPGLKLEDLDIQDK